MKNTDLIKHTAGELAQAAKTLNVPKWYVVRAMEITGSNVRSVVYDFIEKEKQNDSKLLHDIVSDIVKIPIYVGIEGIAQRLEEMGYRVTRSSS